MSKSRTRMAAAVGVAATAAVTAAVLGASPAHAEADVLGANSDNAIDGSYIVMLSDSELAAKADQSLASSYNATVNTTFDNINAVSVEMSASDARKMAADPAVEYVQANMKHEVLGTQDSPPSWGLDRVDQEGTEGDGAYNYPDSAGEGVTSYIIDTGVDYDHSDFEGRTAPGYDAVDGDEDPADGHGHGTHVAGTTAGTEYGLAKSATVVGVRVLDDNGSGTTEQVVNGINWVAENADGPSVANMSLGGGVDQAIDDAVKAGVEAGVTFAVAAGNESADACQGSPSGVEEAITVAASDNADASASFTNFGECVDIYAPGVDIVSAAPGGGEDTMSGTSMASPHVAGAATLYMGENPDATPADVKAALTENALEGVISGVPDGTPNLLLNTGFMLGDGGGEEPGEPDPEPGECTAESAEAVELVDNGSTESTLAVDCDAAASAESTVTVDIEHQWSGDLTIELVSPSGEAYTLKEASLTDWNPNVAEEYTVDLSNEDASGDWTLRVTDELAYFTGTLNSWSLNL